MKTAEEWFNENRFDSMPMHSKMAIDLIHVIQRDAIEDTIKKCADLIKTEQCPIAILAAGTKQSFTLTQDILLSKILSLLPQKETKV